MESLGCCSTPRNSLGVPLGCLCQGPLLPGLCPSSEGQGDLFSPCFPRIQLDMCTPVERKKGDRSYASVEDHLQLQSKAENCKGQGLKALQQVCFPCSLVNYPCSTVSSKWRKNILDSHCLGCAEYQEKLVFRSAPTTPRTEQRLQPRRGAQREQKNQDKC